MGVEMNKFLDAIRNQNMVINYVQVRQGGEIIVDYSRLESKTRLNTWSVSKSVVSAAVGIAIEEGLLSIEEKICDSFEEYLPENAGKNLLEITVRDMLTMTTGLENALFFGDDPERYRTQDWIAYFFNQNFPHENGKRYLYSNFNTYILSCLIERKTGMSLTDYLKPRLFEPLDIFSPDWTRCPMGHVHAANGLYITIDEFANFGQMMLQNGRFHGRQLVPEWYVREASHNQMPETEKNVKYGYQFAISSDESYYRAAGKFGQSCIVLQDRQAVVAVQALESRDFMPLIEEYIISKL